MQGVHIKKEFIYNYLCVHACVWQKDALQLTLQANGRDYHLHILYLIPAVKKCAASVVKKDVKSKVAAKKWLWISRLFSQQRPHTFFTAGLFLD